MTTYAEMLDLTPQMRRRAFEAQLLVDPIGLLIELLEVNGESSLVVANASGVAGSVVRAIQNGRTTDMHTANWAALMHYLVLNVDPKLVPGLGDLEDG